MHEREDFMILLAPSILSADFSNLKVEIKKLEKGGANWLHLDVMDGHFVPNITFGPLVIKAIRKITKLTLDVHLMINHPDLFLEDVREAGADRITVHYETCPHLFRTITKIKELGAKAGVSLNPATPVSFLKEILPAVDLVLIMSVNPGFGGQKFIPSTIKKIQETAQMIRAVNSKILLEVDGGIDEKNVKEVVAAGANVIAAGSAIFESKNVIRAVRQLKQKAESVHYHK